MSEKLSPHQIIANEDYWQEPVTVLDSSLYGVLFRDRIDGDYDRNDIFKIGQLMVGMSSGAEATSLPEGYTLPIPPADSRQLVKVIQDQVKVYPFDPSRTKREDLEAFDRTATEMEEVTLYRGGPASVLARYNDRPLTRAHILRSVFYAIGNKKGTKLVGIPSNNFLKLSASAEELFYAKGGKIIPDVRIGERFRINHSDDWTRKIISAELLEPISAKGSRMPRKRKRAQRNNSQSSLKRSA